MIARRALVSVGIAAGALGLGAGAAAAVDGITQGDAGDVEVTTTTTDATTTTSEATTTTTTPANGAAPPVAESPSTGGEPESDGAPFGLCNAFSGRSQPGNSQAWQRLNEAAGGDIEGYCAEVLAEHRADKGADDDDAEDPGSKDGHQKKAGGEQKGHKGKGGGDTDSDEPED